MLRIVYMGTPQFAVPALELLIQGAAPGVVLPAGYEIVTVITRPDKPVGRGQDVVSSPVKHAALRHHIPVWQPESLKHPENIAAFTAYQADLSIVAAFGQILPQALITQPQHATLNIHASLLPKYRGVSPISEAILQGDHETGVSIMCIDAGVDTGPVVLRRTIPLRGDETTGSLTRNLAELGAEALLEALPLWVSGQLISESQVEQAASHTRKLRKEDGKILWEQPASLLARKVRAYTPWPGTYTYWRGKLLKIIAAYALDTTSSTTQPYMPGQVTIHEESGKHQLAIGTSLGLLIVKSLQLAGKKAMSTEEFLRGYPQVIGEMLN